LANKVKVNKMKLNKVTRKAHVYYEGRLAGTLTETGAAYRFVYDSNYLAGGIPVAYQLPLQEAPFNSDHLPGFFENLVSEGWLRQLQSQEQKIDESDRFGLLLANGRDLVGAVTVIPQTESKGKVK